MQIEKTGDPIEDERRELARDMITLIAEDETFRELLMTDPDAAMEHAGLGARTNKLFDEVVAQSDEGNEVEGFAAFSLGVRPASAEIARPRPQPTWIIAQSSCSCTGPHCFR